MASADACTERNRCRLAQNADVSVDNVFNRLDNRRLNSLTFAEVQDFFSYNHKILSSDEARLLEKVINQDPTSRLTQLVLKEQLLPQTSVDLRTRLESRVIRVPLDSYSEKQLFELLNEELCNSLEVSRALSEVAARHDYNVSELFKLIDQTNKGYIDTLDLVRLLNRNRVHLPESEVEGIVQRLGHQHTGKVNLHELAHTLNTLQPVHVPLGRHTDYTVDVIHRSPVKVKEYVSPTKQGTLDQTTDNKLELARRELNRSRGVSGAALSGQKLRLDTAVSGGSRHASGRKLLQSDESSYAGLIVDTISKDNRAEELREKLSEIPDFNFFDSQLIFERYNKNQIDITDLCSGLDQIGVPKTSTEVDIWVKKYSKGLTYVTFEQFKEAIMPRSRYYTSRVSVRNSNYGAQLSHHTKALFADLIKLLIDNEVTVYRAKESLRTRATWNNQDAWHSLDKVNAGRMTTEDMRQFLKEHRQEVTSSELARLQERIGCVDMTINVFIDDLECKQARY